MSCSTLVSGKGTRCTACSKFNKNYAANLKRYNKKTLKDIKRVRSSLNNLDSLKMKAKNQALIQAKNQLKAAKAVIADCNQKMANLSEDDTKKIPKNQKAVMGEIIAAAKRKSPKGNRYSDEFIMLCMILNIRSKSDYEFLRNIKLLPLPCIRTIRAYMSLVDVKCGFDAKFFELLKKSLSTKKAFFKKRFHGVITIDELALRQSIAVRSDTLTYEGLANMGDIGNQSTDITELADHGLVVQFQSINDKFCQPIAVFT